MRVKNLNKEVADTTNQFKKSFADVLKLGKDKFYKQTSLLVIWRLTKPLTLTEVSNPEDLLLDPVENITSSLANEQKERKRKTKAKCYCV